MSDKDFNSNDDLSLPKATVQKIISEILTQMPHDASAGKESEMTFTRPARDMLISCSLEFLRMLSSESNEISERESKKTISVEHVEQALTDLGFGSYIEGCRGVVGEWQEVQKKRVGRGEKMRNFGGFDKMGEDELRKMQEALLGEARGRMEGGTGGQEAQ
ncbi:negative cofactor 2 transcription regulator complex subunit ncb2 [Cladophialophora chaetospira]|uniref:Negative cofactor 2 transcription regulator complex subunit ncb2 n=1 Tax=Cladophialophora chaetospira TaxID=386627 RepID=A0AA39CIZ9_9EURO|nr:negative cofactor 2 transcription regulator complex subunit ncb2 [Cladophialophora chaetospira]